jgi:hypothetical protein
VGGKSGGLVSGFLLEVLYGFVIRRFSKPCKLFEKMAGTTRFELANSVHDFLVAVWNYAARMAIKTALWNPK